MKNVLTCLFVACLFLMGCQSDTLYPSDLEFDRSRAPSMKLFNLEQECSHLGTRAKVHLVGMQHVSHYQVTAEKEDGTILQVINGTNPGWSQEVYVWMGNPGSLKGCTVFLSNETYVIRAYKKVGTDLFPASQSPRTFTTGDCDCD